MSTEPIRKSINQRRHPPELRERAVRMVRDRIAENGERFGVGFSRWAWFTVDLLWTVTLLVAGLITLFS